MFSASSVPSENSRHFATASPGFPQPRPQGAFLQSQGKAPWGRGWVSREIKPVMGSRNVGYFPCQAPQASLPHPTSMFFLSKKTCRNTIFSPATRYQCESHTAQNSVKIGILFRTWNWQRLRRALQNFSRFELIRRKTFTAVVCRVYWTSNSNWILDAII